MIKILFSDLDLTLLEKGTPDNPVVITERNKKALKTLRDNGIRFCIASGRPDRYSRMVREKIEEPDCDIIACNGACLIIDGQTMTQFLSYDDVKTLAEYVYETSDGVNLRMAGVDQDCTIISDITDGFFYELYHKQFVVNTESTIQDYLDNPEEFRPFQKIYVMIKDGRNEYWQNIFRSRFNDSHEIGCSYPYMMEFMHKGINKGNAVQQIIDYYGYDIEEVAAIGDADNDIAMLEKVKYSFVVERGEEKAKKAAYKVVGDFSDCVDYLLTLK